MKKIIITCSLIAAIASSPMLFAKSQTIANPFGANVYIFDPTMDPNIINSTIQQIYTKQINNDFGDERYAFIFMPGNYGDTTNIDVRTGFYTQVLGAGKTPNNVVIKGAVRTQDRPGGSGVTQIVWRAVENLAIIPTLGSLTDVNIPKDQNVWACSQACPMRRVRIQNNGSLRLYDVGYSTGGFLSDSRIDNTIYSGTQQQFLLRNNNFGTWNGYNWNIVFVGNFGTIPSGPWPTPPYTIVPKTPLIIEKPYLFFDSTTNDFAISKRTRRRNVAGTDWHILGTTIPITAFYIAKPGDTAATINSQLQQKKNILFTPGIYHLTDTIHVTNPNTIIFGLGFPTFVSDNGKPIMVVSDVEGIQIAGPFLFDGGPVQAPTLLQLGEATNNNTHKDPAFLYDIFCRVGGMNSYQSKAASCMTVNSNDVVIDDSWLWRADHGSNIGWTVNTANNGVIVNGKNVIFYNLMAEHFQKYNVLWNGENGSVYEFQNIPPIDVPNQQAWMDGASNGYAQYKVNSNVIQHTVLGMGVYAAFKNAVWLDTSISLPSTCEITGRHIIGFWLGGNAKSGIHHMVNNAGCGVDSSHRRCDIDSAFLK